MFYNSSGGVIIKKINKLFSLAKKFRNAIIKSNKENLPITFNDFPRGSCGDASLLLARFLKEKGAFSTHYILGYKMIHFDNGFNRQTHGWLEYKDIVIDITADQFKEIDESVIVSKDKKWHNQFEVRDNHIADYKIYDAKTIYKLDNAYENIILYL